MDSHCKLDVVDWQDSPHVIVPRNRNPGRFLSPALIGIVGTLLLHAWVIQSVPFGSKSRKAPPLDVQEPSMSARFNADAGQNLVLITLPTAANSTQAAGTENLVSSLPDLAKIKIKSPVNADPPAFLNLESLALSEEQPSKSTAEGADGADQARLFGIYTGQIQARIDRVWQRPRTPINEDNTPAATADALDSFQCLAQIVQDVAGNVKEILLPRCNGSAAWQRSLVLAIQQASPLPAPPSAKVFAHSISLQFVGLPYGPGSSPDGYEFDTSKMARAD